MIPVRLYNIRVFQPGYGPKIITCLMSDLEPISPAPASDLRTQNVVFPLAGAPTSSTLPAGNYSGAIANSGYLAGDISLVGGTAYICMTGGSNSSSVWQAVSGSGSSGLQQFKIQSDAGDYWTAYTWDGTTVGTTLYSIIKPYKLRCGTNAITGEIIQGTAYTYSYASSGGVYARTVSGGSTAETDYIIPSPLQNDIIYAAPCTTSIFGASGVVYYPVVNISLAAGGTGYSASQVLTLSAATGAGGTAATVTIGTVNGSGVILTFSLTNAGSYLTSPTNPVSVTGGSGSGATFNVTLQSPLLDVNADGRAWASQ